MKNDTAIAYLRVSSTGQVKGDGFARGSELVFDGPGLLHALAARNGEFFHLEIRLVQP